MQQPLVAVKPTRLTAAEKPMWLKTTAVQLTQLTAHPAVVASHRRQGIMWQSHHLMIEFV